MALKNLARDLQKSRAIVRDPKILEKWELLEKANGVAVDVMKEALVLADCVVSNNNQEAVRIASIIKGRA